MTLPDSRLNPIVDAVRRATLDAHGSIALYRQQLTATRYYDTVSVEWTGCGLWLVVTCVLQDGRSMTCRVRATDPHGPGRVLALLRAVEFLPDPADAAWPPVRDGVPVR